MVSGDSVREYPRSHRVLRVSTRVLITVLKTTTDRGSPWKTPMLRGMLGVDQSEVRIEADRLEYKSCRITQSSGGA